MPKIAIIGAGSLTFAHRMIIDSLSYPAMQDAHFALIDIDEMRLGYMEKIAKRTFREGNYTKATCSAHTDRRQALKGCDFVIISILTGGWEPIWMDIDIPMKYGIRQAVGDTTGPGGVFRMLRTAPPIIGMANDIMELCPEAIVLNYTNPMSMLCKAAFTAQPDIQWVGLCHSVQGTAHEWCNRCGIPKEEANYVCAGINHLAWFLKFEHKGKDVLPLIREKAVELSVWKGDTSRCEYVKHFGHPVTESCGHNSEYAYWFRKRQDLEGIYCDPKNNVWNTTGILKMFYKEGRGEEDMQKVLNKPEPYDLSRSLEYGSQIMNAKLTGEPVVINGNVPNRSYITNLPQNSIVEVPILVSKNGLQPIAVGDLPAPLAALDQANVNVHEMAIKGLFNRDPEMIFSALAFDPLTSAVCSLDETRDMTAEMFEAEAEYLPEGLRNLERKPKPWLAGEINAAGA